MSSVAFASRRRNTHRRFAAHSKIQDLFSHQTHSPPPFRQVIRPSPDCVGRTFARTSPTEWFAAPRLDPRTEWRFSTRNAVQHRIDSRGLSYFDMNGPKSQGKSYKDPSPPKGKHEATRHAYRNTAPPGYSRIQTRFGGNSWYKRGHLCGRASSASPQRVELLLDPLRPPASKSLPPDPGSAMRSAFAAFFMISN